MSVSAQHRYYIFEINPNRDNHSVLATELDTCLGQAFGHSPAQLGLGDYHHTLPRELGLGWLKTSARLAPHGGLLSQAFPIHRQNQLKLKQVFNPQTP
jgi:hypothetical protein